MKLLGDWNWYLPKWLEWLPRLEHGEGAGSTGRAGEQRLAAPVSSVAHSFDRLAQGRRDPRRGGPAHRGRPGPARARRRRLCTSSTTTSCSRTPGPRPATISSAASSRSGSSSCAGSSTRDCARGSRDDRARSPVSSASSPEPKPSTTRGQAGRPATTTPGSCRSRPASLLIGLGAVTLWRSRRTDDRLWWRYLRRSRSWSAAVFVFVSAVLFPFSVAYVVTHAARATVPAADLGAPYEDVAVHDERRAAPEGLVHPVAERSRGDLVPGPHASSPEAGQAARTPRIRRPALRPPRRGRERGRPEHLRLAGRARRPRGGRVPAAATGRRSPSGSAASASRSAAR